MQVWVPDDLMAVQAYILWEKAGKPDGADFAGAARDEIHRQLKAGVKLEVRARAFILDWHLSMLFVTISSRNSVLLGLNDTCCAHLCQFAATEAVLASCPHSRD